MTAPTLSTTATRFLATAPIGVKRIEDVLVVGDAEVRYCVRRNAGWLQTERTVRDVVQETVMLSESPGVLEAYLLVAFGNTWRGHRGLPLLSLWGQVGAQPPHLALVEDGSTWTVASDERPPEVLAKNLRRPDAARLARALQHSTDQLVQALEDVEGDALYEVVP